MVRRNLFYGMLVGLGLLAGVCRAGTPEELPPLLEALPSQPYEVLSPVGAGKKTILQAREQLQREALKVQAAAVIRVKCEPGGVGRQGMTWYPKNAYCQGLAIRYKNSDQASSSAAPALPFDPNRFR